MDYIKLPEFINDIELIEKSIAFLNRIDSESILFVEKIDKIFENIETDNEESKKNKIIKNITSVGSVYHNLTASLLYLDKILREGNIFYKYYAVNVYKNKLKELGLVEKGKIKEKIRNIILSTEGAKNELSEVIKVGLL